MRLQIFRTPLACRLELLQIPMILQGELLSGLTTVYHFQNTYKGNVCFESMCGFMVCNMIIISGNCTINIE